MVQISIAVAGPGFSDSLCLTYIHFRRIANENQRKRQKIGGK